MVSPTPEFVKIALLSLKASLDRESDQGRQIEAAWQDGSKLTVCYQPVPKQDVVKAPKKTKRGKKR